MRPKILSYTLCKYKDEIQQKGKSWSHFEVQNPMQCIVMCTLQGPYTTTGKLVGPILMFKIINYTSCKFKDQIQQKGKRLVLFRGLKSSLV